MSTKETSNPYPVIGFVHGGNLIRLMEEAGFVAATRQIAFSGNGGGGKLGALVRMDHLDFLAPVEVNTTFVRMPNKAKIEFPPAKMFFLCKNASK